MGKIKSIFAKMFAPIGRLISKFRSWLSEVWYKFRQTKFMVKLGAILSFIPKKIASKIQYNKRKAVWGIVFIIPLMIGFIYFFFIPFMQTVYYSFCYVKGAAGEGVQTQFLGLGNYQYIFSEHPTYTQTLSSSIISILVDVPIILIFSLIIAVILNTQFKGRALVRAIFFMPVIFNSQAIEAALSTSTVMQDSINATTTELFASMFSFQDFLLSANLPVTFVGYLGDAVTRIYDIISYSGVQILIFLSGIQSVPKHLYEAAKIEGATQYEIFWKITFPMVSPLMLTAGVYTIVDAFLRSDVLRELKQFISAGNVTSNYGIASFLGTPIDDGIKTYLSNYGINAAMSWLFCLGALLIIAIILFLLSRMVFYYDE